MENLLLQFGFIAVPFGATINVFCSHYYTPIMCILVYVGMFVK